MMVVCYPGVLQVYAEHRRDACRVWCPWLISPVSTRIYDMFSSEKFPQYCSNLAAGLMPNLVPAYSKKDCFKKRRDWKKFNTYFDEKTIRSAWDYFIRDEHGIKKEFHKSLGLEWDEEPWKKRPTLDVSTTKLVHY